MGVFAAGSIVVVPFPFSDLSQSKLRPAVVLASVGRSDWILCQTTSNRYGDSTAIELTKNDFSRGALRVTSCARPGKLFTAHESLITVEVGELSPLTFNKIREAVIALFR